MENTMSMSESITELAVALSKAQGMIRNADTSGANTHTKKSYSNITDIWDAIREPLSLNNLAVIQMPTNIGGAIKLETMLIHASGQWLKSALIMAPEKTTPQGLGSVITYAKRYALSALMGVTSRDDDDDGHEASNKSQNNRQQQGQPVFDKNLEGCRNWVVSELMRYGVVVNQERLDEVLNICQHCEMPEAAAKIRSYAQAAHDRIK